MKNVLLLLHDDEGQEGRLQVALDVTRALAGHLTCLNVIVPPVFVPDYYIVPGEPNLLAQVFEREAANVARMRARLASEDVTWEIQEAYGGPAERLNDVADLADVIVVSLRSGQNDAYMRGIVSEVAAKSGRLVIAVPPGCTSLDLTGKALVAWDGSHEASQALRASLPLLRLARDVTVMEVRPPGEQFDVGDAAVYLSRHEIGVNVVEKTSTDPISDTLLSQATDSGASYLVMGAYGQSRIMEALFGGVTTGVLRRTVIPVFLRH